MEHILKILAVFGSIAIFIFGMKQLSDGVEKVSGLRTRLFLKRITGSNPSAILAGFSITSILQSSSAVSVLLLSFVNAGMINLRKAFGVIIGANIGTTFTLWLIALGAFGFDLYKVLLPLSVVALVLYMSRKEERHFAGMAIFGAILIFTGLYLAKLQIPENFNALIKEMLFGREYASGQYGVLFLALLLAVIVTITLQSSSVSTVLFAVVATAFDFELALAFIIGANIGTTSTALIASVIGDFKTKSVAYFHLVFNLIGALLFFFFIPLLAPIFFKIAESFSDLFSNITVLSFKGNKATNTAFGLAFFHTFFNMATAAVVLPIIPWIIKKYLKSKIWSNRSKQHEKYTPREIDLSPEVYIFEGNQMMQRFSGNTVQIIANLGKILVESDRKSLDKQCELIIALEKESDLQEKAIRKFLNATDHKLLDIESFRRREVILDVCHHLENIGDLAIEACAVYQARRDTSSYITPKLRSYLIEMQGILDQAISQLVQNMNEKKEDVNLSLANELENSLNEVFRTAIDHLFRIIDKEKLPPRSLLYFRDLLIEYEQIGDHIYKASRALKD